MENLWLLKWAGKVRSFFQEMNSHKNENICSRKNVCEPILLNQYEKRYDELVEQGKNALTFITENTFEFDELRKMTKRLYLYKGSYMLFMRDYDAPFMNNLA